MSEDIKSSHNLWKWLGGVTAVGAAVAGIQSIDSIFITRSETVSMIEAVEDKDREDSITSQEQRICSLRSRGDSDLYELCIMEFQREALIRR